MWPVGGVLAPPGRLVPPLVYPGVSICPALCLVLLVEVVGLVVVLCLRLVIVDISARVV